VDIAHGSILAIPLSSNSVTHAVSLDVLEHVRNDAAALRELIRVTKRDGIILLNVPAFNILWSEWDISLGHERRYTLGSFRALLQSAGSEIHIEHLAYTNTFVFPFVFVYRLFARAFHLKSRLEDQIPSKPINRLLETLYGAPGTWQWFHPPFGVSVFAVLRKR